MDDTIVRPTPPGTSGPDWPRPDDPRWGPPPEDAGSGPRSDAAGWGPAGPTDLPAEVPLDGPGDPAGPADPSDLSDRLAALGHATRVAARYLTPAEAPGLAVAAELAARGGARLSLTGLEDLAPDVPRDLAIRLRGVGHTVVALAGPTGAGKSSLLNALAGLELSPPGHLRPTTGEAYACVWDARRAGILLDWLGVAPKRRFVRESPLDAEDQAALRGLVLVDLPDVDSIAAGNRIEADRLVGIVDRVIWVLDPQKYADQTVHDDYLRHLGALRDVTVVVLNQVDRLTPADAHRCQADLARLVAADFAPTDGSADPTGADHSTSRPEVPVIGISTVTGEGIGELRALLEKVVADRCAAVNRLEAELAEAVMGLAPVAPGAGPTEPDLSQRAVPELAEGLAAACGVDALAADAAAVYRRHTVIHRWPVPLGRAGWRDGEPARPTLPPADPVAVGQSLRRLAEGIGAWLPEPWSRQIRAAATADHDRLPEELAEALALARGRSPASPLWTVLRASCWLTVAAGLITVGYGLSTGELRPWLPLGVAAVVATVAVAGLVTATGAWRARRYRRAVARRMREAALTVAREVVAPVRRILRDYGEVHAALERAATPAE